MKIFGKYRGICGEELTQSAQKGNSEPIKPTEPTGRLSSALAYLSVIEGHKRLLEKIKNNGKNGG